MLTYNKYLRLSHLNLLKLVSKTLLLKAYLQRKVNVFKML